NFLNPGVDQCIANAKNRPWEPHKYPSKAAQDENLNMLLNWIVQYTERDDVFSYQSHMRFYQDFNGKKHIYTSNN
ncbi:MAG: shikimate kinase, partial [Gammaproteobacteria bacterium]|nr:shikimate kinase [Gammaproteobacteria bacterium]